MQKGAEHNHDLIYLSENGNDPLKKEEVDEMMEDCGSGDRFNYIGKEFLAPELGIHFHICFQIIAPFLKATVCCQT